MSPPTAAASDTRRGTTHDERQPMSALLFGSISTIADTSELQRQAFNRAFEAHGLAWRWDQDEYRSLLRHSGGERRIAQFADDAGGPIDAGAVHRTKSELFQTSLAESQIAPRPGVVETVREAHDTGVKVAFVTTTSPANVSALMRALGSDLAATDFDLIVDRSHVQRSKPDPAAYVLALKRLGLQPSDCVAIEDNLGGVDAARAARVSCIAFPNENTAGHDFDAADGRVDRLSFAELQKLVSAP